MKEEPMSSQQILPQYQEGDRVRVDKDVATPTALPGYVGIIKEVVPSYGDNTVGYNISLVDDPRPGRVWFFLQHQLKRA